MQPKNIFSINQLDYTNISKNNPSEDLREILVRSGAFNVEIDFRPNRHFISNYKINSNDNHNLQLLLNKLITNSTTFYLIPDTNFLINGFYSNFLKPFKIV